MKMKRAALALYLILQYAPLLGTDTFASTAMLPRSALNVSIFRWPM